MSNPHLHAALELLHAANLRATRAEAALDRVRAVLDAHDWIEFDLIREALEGQQ